jgi:predicted pyridoxine 5'-phosphate oxidase superfamily flavin-nucleotide-binding protein
MPADGETKTGAAVFARCSRGGLGELLEQFAHLLRRHADTRIGHRERDPVATALLPLASVDGDSAFLGELVGVTRQVEQALPEAGLVSVHRIEVRWAFADDPIAILRRHRLDGLGHVLDHGQQRKPFEMKLHAPGLDLGEVEDIVDQCEQVATRAEHAAQWL